MAPGWDLSQCVEAWEQVGLAGIGLTIAGVEAVGIDRTIEVLQSSRIQVAELMGLDPFDVVRPERFFAKLPRVLAQLDIAAILKADCVYACAGSRADVDWDMAADRLVDQIEALVPHLKQRGVRLALEPIHPLRQDLSFVNLASDVEDLLARLPDSSIGYVYDFWHLWWQRDAIEVARRTAPRVFSAQPSDHKPLTFRTPDRAVPGHGIAPVASLVQALEEGGFSGFYDLEILSPDNEERGYYQTLSEGVAGFADAVGGICD
jgi:sugar phosphate isomerase/epimerase